MEARKQRAGAPATTGRRCGFLSGALAVVGVVLVPACRGSEPASAPEPSQPSPTRAVDALGIDAPHVDVRAALGAATALTIYAIDPGRGGDRTAGFHGNPIQNTVPVPPDQVATVAAAIVDGFRPAMQPTCFDPHHGVRVAYPDGTLDLVICFACASTHIYVGDAFAGREDTKGTAEPALARYVGETPEPHDSWSGERLRR